MQVILHSTSKQFGKKWILKDLNYIFESGKHYAITGKNGSGKSTLLLIIGGYITPSSGKVEWITDGRKLVHEGLFGHISLASPYLELLEEFSLEEMLNFQSKFKPFRLQMNVKNLIEISELGGDKKLPLKYYSSGMRQRVKLLMAIMSSSNLVLLDEPCSNLDSASVEWYQKLKNEYGNNRSFIICSNNNLAEYPDVEDILTIQSTGSILSELYHQ